MSDPQVEASGHVPPPEAGDAADVPAGPEVAGPNTELDPRKARILSAIVADYVSSAEPVGSRRVVEIARLDVSAATVRNEMAALEEAGYISQPHTSAGRVPTDKGYRFFVDEIQRLQAAGTDESQRETVRGLLGEVHDLEDLLRRTTTVLSELTHLVSLVIEPAVDPTRLKLVELVSLAPQAVLLLLVTDDGRVEKRLLELAGSVGDHDLERAKTVLNDAMRGRRVVELGTVVGSLVDEAPSELQELVGQVAAAVGELGRPQTDRVFVGGAASLAGEGALERGQLSQVLELLEDRVTVARLLAESATGDETLVRIGEEHELEELQTTSLIAQRYRLLSAGSVGVLGPTRMDYARVLSTVRAVADQLQRTLHHLGEGSEA